MMICLWAWPCCAHCFTLTTERAKYLQPWSSNMFWNMNSVLFCLLSVGRARTLLHRSADELLLCEMISWAVFLQKWACESRDRDLLLAASNLLIDLPCPGKQKSSPTQAGEGSAVNILTKSEMTAALSLFVKGVSNVKQALNLPQLEQHWTKGLC